MHTNIEAHTKYLWRHFRNNLDFEIGVVVHTMRTMIHDVMFSSFNLGVRLI
jgi:hypothetical protein